MHIRCLFISLYSYLYGKVLPKSNVIFHAFPRTVHVFASKYRRVLYSLGHSTRIMGIYNLRSTVDVPTADYAEDCLMYELIIIQDV